MEEEFEDDTDVLIEDVHLQCPVCKDLYVRPRMYPCGHSCCEECMITMDRLKAETSIYHTPLYKCPCCRAESIFKWYSRPINHALSSICRLHPNYETRLEEVGETKEKEDTAPADVNLRTLAMESRHHIAVDLYDKLLPLLYAAAGEGRRHVVITDKQTIRRIELVCDILSKLLFDRHNVYKVLCTRNECQVIFSDDAFTILREYTNSAANPPLPTTPIRLVDIDTITQTLNTIQEELPLRMMPPLQRRDNFTAMLEEELRVEGERLDP